MQLEEVGPRHSLRDVWNKEMSDSIANRSCDTSQTVTIDSLQSCIDSLQLP
jgi:hypothetical protein